MLNKEAANRLMKFLRALPKPQQLKHVRQLPVDLRSTAAYKLKAGDAANLVKRLPDDHGHGPSHIFAVTRDFQKSALPKRNSTIVPMSTAQRRVGTMSALLHDIGRRAEDPVVARMGKRIGKLPHHYWHSESGGRFAKKFLHQDPMGRMIQPNFGNDVKNVIRVHDTDAHKLLPDLKAKMLDDPTQLAARGLYSSDKADALGSMGALRTFQTGKGYNETVRESANFAARENLDKYRRIIAEYAPEHRQADLMQRLNDYKRMMKGWAEMTPHRIPKNTDELEQVLRFQEAVEARRQAMRNEGLNWRY